jgi:branched-chain amino acid transport system permease protein
MGALGVQLLIGFCGHHPGPRGVHRRGGLHQHASCASVSLARVYADWGLAYPMSIVAAAIAAGLWSVLFGLPSAKVKGFYLILTTMAAQFITVDFIIDPVCEPDRRKRPGVQHPPGSHQDRPMDRSIQRSKDLLLHGWSS